MSFCRGEGAVNAAVTEPEIPGLALFSTVLPTNVVDGPFGVVVGGVAGRHDGVTPVFLDELIVVIVAGISLVAGAVPDELVIPVTSVAGIGSGVPLSNLGSLVPGLSKLGGPEPTFFRIVGAAGVFTLHPHRLDSEAVMPGQQGRARWHAPSPNRSVVKADSALREGVDVRCIDPVVGLGIT